MEEALSKIEKNEDVEGAILLYRESGPDLADRDVARIMFVLVDYLAERSCTGQQADKIILHLREIYWDSRERYSARAGYLFFTGIIITRGEWYFAQNGVDEAIAYLKKAVELEPSSLLFQWGYIAMLDQRPTSNSKLKYELASGILESNDLVQWLLDTGALGKYVLGFIENNVDSNPDSYAG